MKWLCTLLLAAACLGVWGQNCKQADYPMDGSAADTTANAINGSVVGAPALVADHNSQPNSAMNFDGAADRFDLPDLFDHQYRTISIWFNADTILASGSGVLYNSDYNTVQYGGTILRAIDVGGPKLRYQAGTIWYEEPIVAGQWYMATLVVDDDSVFCYLGCNLVGSFLQDFGNSATGGDGNTKIGCSRNHTNYFDGSIDNIKIYDCALTPSEICALTDVRNIANNVGQLNVYPNPTTGVVRLDGQWSMDKVQVLDVFGREAPLAIIPSTSSIDLSSLPNGVYFVKVGEHTEKVVLQH